ncbi:hypothetical protein Daus18300_000277 [Diaporthe australafricana]|uniref:Uncharacterized protein n=1 Tax=Diaporthe australafricana TaxID=127596 RepID=A0ABR3Y669_9PEZI
MVMIGESLEIFAPELHIDSEMDENDHAKKAKHENQDTDESKDDRGIGADGKVNGGFILKASPSLKYQESALAA